MCALYKKREDVPSNIAHQLTEALIQGTDSILVLGEKFRIHVNIVKSMGISCLGRAMFNAREQKARALLFNNIIACLKQGLDSYTICKRLGIQAKVLYAIAPEYAHCNWQDLVEQYQNKAEDVVEDTTDSEPEAFGFIQVTDNATEAEAEVAPTETAPASAPVKRDTPRVPGKYYPVDRCQGYHHHDKRYNKPYQDRRQQSQHNNNFGGYKVVTDLIINGNTMTAVRIITVMVVEVTLLTTIIIGSRYLSTKYRCAIRTWSLALIVAIKIHVR